MTLLIETAWNIWTSEEIIDPCLQYDYQTYINLLLNSIVNQLKQFSLEKDQFREIPGLLKDPEIFFVVIESVCNLSALLISKA